MAFGSRGAGQVARAHRVVGELRPAAHQRPLDALEPRRAGLVEQHAEHHGSSRPVGQQARRLFGQRRRVERHLAVGHVHGGATAPGLAIERIAGAHEPPDVGDRVVQPQIVPGALEVQRLVEIARRRGVERDERDVGAIDVLVAEASPYRHIGRVQHLGRERIGQLELVSDPA